MKIIKGHQGDVQFKSINELPKNAIEIDNKPIALGEIHGHAHVVTGDVKRYEVDNRIFYEIGEKGGIIQHVLINMMTLEKYNSTEILPMADHKPHKLEKGIYEFYIQNEYNPYEKIMKKVVD